MPISRNERERVMKQGKEREMDELWRDCGGGAP